MARSSRRRCCCDLGRAQRDTARLIRQSRGRAVPEMLLAGPERLLWPENASLTTRPLHRCSTLGWIRYSACNARRNQLHQALAEIRAFLVVWLGCLAQRLATTTNTFDSTVHPIRAATPPSCTLFSVGPVQAESNTADVRPVPFRPPFGCSPNLLQVPQLVSWHGSVSHAVCLVQ